MKKALTLLVATLALGGARAAHADVPNPEQTACTSKSVGDCCTINENDESGAPGFSDGGSGSCQSTQCCRFDPSADGGQDCSACVTCTVGSACGAGTGDAGSTSTTGGGSTTTGGTSVPTTAGSDSTTSTPSSGCSAGASAVAPWVLALTIPLALSRRRKS